jgi:uncharacterized membrane protein
MVHSGGFYQTEKRRPGPGEVPAVLHWFKWEALLTWISGVALLVLIYYLSGAYLLDPAVSSIGRGAATALGIALLVAGWAVYDGLWRSPLADRTGVATAVSLVLLAAVTIALCRLLSGRAAYMHVGALLGTLMVANVWMRILPAQRKMIAAAVAGAPTFAAVRAVVVQRCLPCHSRFPSDPTFGAAPAGVAFDTPESIAGLAERIRVRAVETRTMPLANKTGMTAAERALLSRWIAAGAPLR